MYVELSSLPEVASVADYLDLRRTEVPSAQCELLRPDLPPRTVADIFLTLYRAGYVPKVWPAVVAAVLYAFTAVIAWTRESCSCHSIA